MSKRALIPSDGAARGFDVPYRADDVKIGAADFGDSGPSVARVTLSPMNSQPGKLSVLPGRVKTGGVTPVVYDEPLLRLARSSVVSRINGRKPFALSVR